MSDMTDAIKELIRTTGPAVDIAEEITGLKIDKASFNIGAIMYAFEGAYEIAISNPDLIEMFTHMQQGVE